MMIQGTPIHVCTNIIEQYIMIRKGVQINIKLPIETEHEEKFIQALTIACNHFNIEL